MSRPLAAAPAWSAAARVGAPVLSFGQLMKNLNSLTLPSYHLTSRALTNVGRSRKIIRCKSTTISSTSYHCPGKNLKRRLRRLVSSAANNVALHDLSLTILMISDASLVCIRIAEICNNINCYTITDRYWTCGSDLCSEMRSCRVKENIA